ncbi:zinc-binding dehydrogenase [Streptomyces sp. NPDC013457]|uniref:zinc-binding dehydrogenase n=1 Tax=Streptomyces sp. NPDC013457 TaxID=3364866 RepID=UPI0036FEEBC4
MSLDYRREDFVSAPERHDLLFDLVGNRSLAECRRALTPTGRLVLSGGGVFEGGILLGPMALLMQGKVMSRFVTQRLVLLSAAPGRERLAALRDLVERGRVTPVIDRTYPLSEAAEAIRYLEAEHARAKVVVSSPPPSAP